jgi:hypothetical protein
MPTSTTIYSIESHAFLLFIASGHHPHMTFCATTDQNDPIDLLVEPCLSDTSIAPVLN